MCTQPEDGGERAFEDNGLRLRHDQRGPARRSMPVAEVCWPLRGRIGGPDWSRWPLGTSGRRRWCWRLRRPGLRGRALGEPDPAYSTGGAVHIPGAGLAQDDGRFRRQLGRHVGLKGALTAEAERLAGRMPASPADPRQQPQHGIDRAGRHRASAFAPAAQQTSHDAVRIGPGRVVEDVGRRRRRLPSRAIADQHGRDEAGVGRLAGRELEPQRPPLLGWSRRERV